VQLVPKPHTPVGTRSLRHSVLIALAVGFLLLSAAQYFVAGEFIERHLNALESEEAFFRLGNLHHALDVMHEDLTATTADWAQWDDTFAFVSRRMPSYTTGNLYPQVLTRLRLSFFIAIDAQGGVVFAKGSTADGNSFRDLPPDLVELAQADGPLGMRAVRTTLTGLVAGRSDVFLVSSQAVPSPEGRPGGRLIMGRSLTEVVTPALARMTGQSLRIVTGQPAPDELRRIDLSRQRDTLAFNPEMIDAATPLEDLWGREVARLHVAMERPIQGVLSEARFYLLIATLIIGFLFCAIGLALIRSRVIVPLEQLEATVTAIGEQGHPAARVDLKHGAREFRTLSASINAMLQQLEQQQTMRRDRDAALEANRLKSEFLATMSHEIRTPMNGVLGMCELLQRTDLDPKQRHLAETILRSARSLLDILNDILDFSKIESGKLELDASAFSPAELVQTIAAPFIAAAQAKGLEFVVRIESGVPSQLIGDAIRLRQILNNLLSNAVKFTAQGSVCVSCALVHAEDDKAQLRFTVADTGIGVSLQARERIFEPFAQAESSTTRRFGGTGLGLAIVRRLVTLMGGEIELHSEPGIGSTFAFTVLLRRAPEQIAQRSALGEGATGPRLSLALAPSVLLAEDNAVNREVLTEMLQHIGCHVTAVENGSQVLAAVATRTFDVILMDCQMPVMDGHTATKELRALERATQQESTFIIALTADATPENRRRCFDAGMDTVVTKPVTQARLRDLILQVVRPQAAAESGS
jgi:signal transduction histidine kinase